MIGQMPNMFEVFYYVVLLTVVPILLAVLLAYVLSTKRLWKNHDDIFIPKTKKVISKREMDSLNIGTKPRTVKIHHTRSNNL